MFAMKFVFILVSVISALHTTTTYSFTTLSPNRISQFQDTGLITSPERFSSSFFSPKFRASVDESFLINPFYRSNEQVEELMFLLEQKFPNRAKIHYIGSSLEGRNIIALEISSNIQKRGLLVPMFKFIGNMHGDEPVGRELILNMALYLLNNYGKDQEVTKLVDTTDIFLLPTMNPDGYARSQEGRCESLPQYVGRSNAVGVDLNRDFPDRLDNKVETQLKVRQPETLAMMQWIINNPFVLSANFHGGAVVASYPFDNSVYHHECCEDSPTPDDKMFRHLARTYSQNHPVMRTGRDCNETFVDGIVNGAYWYELSGGMQDFNYVFSNCFELTLELSCCKFPPASELASEWQKNKRSMLEFMKKTHLGVKGMVQDINGYPIRGAEVLVQGLEQKPIRTTERGEYWRLLEPGTYNIQIIAFGFNPSEVKQVTVTASAPARVDFNLRPVSSNNDGPYKHVRVERQKPDENGFLTPTKFEHHNFKKMEKFIFDLSESYPSITRVYSIGKSVEDRDLWVMEITKTPGKHIPGIPEFKYVANMHGNEVVGREMLLYLAKYLCEHYMLDDRITQLINTTRMHFLFSMNPDGYEISREGDKSSLVGRANANKVDLNRNFPDQYGVNKYNQVQEAEVQAVMNWTLSIPFVLSANLHGGSLVANYPFDDSAKDFIHDHDPRTVYNPTDDNQIFIYLARLFSNAHSTMHLAKPCPLFLKEHFKEGITNGAQWYSVTGGMQDWNYVKAGIFELTLELGCVKFPVASQLPMFWQQNREALIKYIEQVHRGAYGYIRSSIANPVNRAMVSIDGINHITYSSNQGDYWRLLLPGKYNLTVSADGFEPHREEITVPEDQNSSVRIDISLMRDDEQHWSSAHDYRVLKNVHKTIYHENKDILSEMTELANNHNNVALFNYIDTDYMQEYPSLKVTLNIGSPEETKFHVLVMSSVFISSPLGREMTMNLARHVIEGYKLGEPTIKQLLHRTVFHFMPILHDFDEIMLQYERNYDTCDPIVMDDLGDQLLSPEKSDRRDLLFKLLEIEKFDAILTFSAGMGSDIMYPQVHDLNKINERFAERIKQTEFRTIAPICTANPSRINQKNSLERLTNLLQNIYHIPMFTVDISCCRMPVESDIGNVWRKNIGKFLNFMHLGETGVEGYVKNEHGEPLRNAYFEIAGNPLVFNVTKNLAHFRLMLPTGRYELVFNLQGFVQKRVHFKVEERIVTNLGDVIIENGTAKENSNKDYDQGEALFVYSKETTNASIEGYILDASNTPVPNAKITIIKPKQTTYVNSDNMGKYTLVSIPTGNITLQAEARGYITETRRLCIEILGQSVRGVLIHLKIDESVGFSNSIIYIFGFVLILIVIMGCACCAQLMNMKKVHGDKPYYNFSILPQSGKLFADEDDETEIFRTPAKKGVKATPYYDDERDPIIDTDEDSEEEIIMLDKTKGEFVD